MARFLHIADIHLGFDRYGSPARTKDFFFALEDVFQRYAVQEQVDFVLICGDLFEHRTIQPAILNQAQLCLQRLKTAGIPVLAIEGNHDNRPYGTTTSWLKYLAQWGLLILLEPGNEGAGEPFYSPWDEAAHRGGYIDLPCGIRVLGSQWYGATAPQAIQKIAAELEMLPPQDGPTVLMFHHGLEGQIARYSGALRYKDLLPLRQVGVDYLALGHIHKNYSVDDWVFNPGSLEANNVEESGYARGAYLVSLTPTGVTAELKRDYRQREIVRLTLETRGQESLEDLQAAAIATVETAIAQGTLNPDQEPMVELRLEGSVGFEPLDLDTRQLQTQLQTLSNALIFLLKSNLESVAFQSPMADDASRDAIELNAFLDLLTGHRDYKKRAESLAQGLIDLKDRCLTGRNDEELYALVETLLQAETEHSSRQSD
ncbi:exonuclease SbcCD subunit D [Leptolyngbya sp. PCC 6406]|uniref:metallophosphoesterase family protein n=1 Tax=Leptolyngbya sp. PCC 6406 TaxID=1173264 RepID=UPI0002AC16B7|nr:DNA repair exonuclease [Leptolyngbya sp. PCC 6406]